MRPTLPLAAALLAVAAAGCATPGSRAPEPAPASAPTLRAFRSDAELQAYHHRLAVDYERRLRKHPPPPPPPPPPPAPPPVGDRADPAASSITNVQTAGVDEGGIVKLHGEYLVVLRRGRLFTVRLGDESLQPVAAVDAFGPGIDPQRTWYDEILVSGDNVAVIGYSYQRGGTEVGLFRIDPAGRLTHRGTYQLRSGDYYSQRNYASRLIGTKLIFYSPIYPGSSEGSLDDHLPAFRRWDSADSAFRRTVPPTRVYRAAGRVSMSDGLVLHTVTVCDLASPDLECQATALYGPPSREFYVSGQAVYIWSTTWPAWDEDEDRPPHTVLYRMPLDGGAPTGLQVAGRPVDQFSFLESGDGHLNVLLRFYSKEPMPFTWTKRGEPTALLRVPLTDLGDGARAASAARYHPLTTAGGGVTQNRYVGSWLLYGQSRVWADTLQAPLYAVRWAAPDSATPLPVRHDVQRIEAMGSGAVVVGSAGRSLRFTGVRLGSGAALADVYTRQDAAQAESRSQGFFYRAEGPDAGLLGLPILGARSGSDPGMLRGSARVLFLRNDAFRFSELGDLAASDAGRADDGCRASCVDWYGNARPLFIRGRIFALMGYDLVEGRVEVGRIREVRRVNFQPAGPAAAASTGK